MSYHRNRHSRAALGDVASTASAAGSVVSDPYFGEVVCRIQQLSAIEERRPVPACATTPSGKVGGIGLRAAMPPLRAYVAASRRPYKWPLYAAVAGVIGVPMLIGYAIGKGRR